MTEGLIRSRFPLLTPETVTPAVLYLVSEDAPSKTIICAGAGLRGSQAFETEGVCLPPDKLARKVSPPTGMPLLNGKNMKIPQTGFEQTGKFAMQGAAKLGIDLSA